MNMENVFRNIITVNNISFCHGLFKTLVYFCGIENVFKMIFGKEIKKRVFS